MQPAPHPYALPTGTRLHSGKYAVSNVLGQGGFALTYRGGDMAARRYVAVKEFFPAGAARRGNQVVFNDPAAFEHAKASFLEEASVLSKFAHPNIVRVLDRFEENGTAYVILEFLEGKTLGQRLREGKLMDEWEAVMLGLKLSEALETIHSHGLLHRDIKPDNIILTNDGRSVLIDFGTARDYSTSGSAPMTQVLTAGYAPLEQYAANAAQGPQTDIYALSATLYHAMSGEPPVAATDRALDIPLVPLRSKVQRLSPLVANTISCGLSLDVAGRPATARHFADMLQGKLTAKPPELMARPAPQPAAPQPPPPPVMAAPPPMPAGIGAPGTKIKGAVGGPELEANLEFMKLKKHSLAVNALAFSPDGSILISSGHDRVIQQWTVNDALPGVSMNGHNGAVTCMAYSPDGSFLLTGTLDGVLTFWNLSTRQPGPILRDVPGEIHTLAFCLTRRIFACGGAGEWSVRDGNTGQVLARTSEPCPAVDFSPDGSYLAAGYAGGKVQLVSSTTGGPIGSLQAHSNDIEELAFSPDGALLATGGIDGFIRVWQVSNGQMLWEQQPFILPAAGVSWSPDGRFLASAHRDSVYIWTREGALWRGYTHHTDRIRDVTFAPRAVAPYSYVLASSSRDRTVELCRITV